MRTGDLNYVKQLADDFTPGDVYASEAFDILAKNADITPELRDLIIQKVRNGTIWSRGPREVTTLFNGTFRQVLFEQHMNSPGLFKTKVQDMVDQIIDFTPTTLDELNQKMTFVDNVSEMYGDVIHVSLEAAQLQGRITNPGLKDTMFNQWWTERVVPHMVDTEAQVTRLVTDMKANLATSDVLAGMSTEQKQVYLDLLDAQVDRIGRIQTARLQQNTLRRSFFDSGNIAGSTRGTNYLDPASRSQNNGKFWDDFFSQQDLIFRQIQPNIAETERGIFSLGTKLPGYQVPNIVDASQRVLLPRDVAHLFGVDVNLLTRNMYAPELLALRGRAHFVNRIRDKAEKAATAQGKDADELGYTKDKISDIYDRVTRDIQTSDVFQDSLQPGLIALENVRQELIRLGTRRGVLVSDGYKGFVDELMKGVEDFTPASTRTRSVEELTEAGGLGTVPDINNQQISITEARDRIRSLEAQINPERRMAGLIEVGPGSEILRTSELRQGLNEVTQFEGVVLDDGTINRLEQGLNIAIPENREEAIRAIIQEQEIQARRIVNIRDRANTLQAAIDEETASTIERGIAGIGLEEVIPETSVRAPARIDEELAGRGVAGTSDIAGVNRTFTDEWQVARQDAMAETNIRYNQDFPDFDNQNAWNTAIKPIYPFWGYEAHRWAYYLPREALRHPGTISMWGKYQDYTEQGYIHIPGTDLAGNIIRGTIAMGGMRRLFMRDYPEFYDNFGGVAEVNDWFQRFGFYPGAGVGTLFSIFGAKTGSSQLGEVVPAWGNVVINSLAATFPESELVKILQDRIFPNRWRDYLISVEIGKLGFNGIELLIKQAAGTKLEPDEQRIWDEGRQGVANYALWSEQFAMTRMDPEERRKFHREVALVLNEITGISIEDLEDMRRNGLRVEDIAGGSISPESYQQVATLSGWHRWSGAGMVLGPSEIGEQRSITREFWDEIRSYSERESDILLTVEQELSIADNQGRPMRTIDQWMDARAEKSKRVNERIRDLKSKDRYREVPITLEERKNFAEVNKLLPVIDNSMLELQELWFAVELDTQWRNPDTGRREANWDKFFDEKHAIELGITDVDPAVLPRFRDFIRRNSSPLTIKHSDASRELFRPYRQLLSIIQSQFSPEEQKLIEEFRTTDDQDKEDQLQEEVTTLEGFEGSKLISTYQRLLTTARTNMREADPELDAWLVFFNKNMELQSEEGLRRWRAIRQEQGIVSVTE